MLKKIELLVLLLFGTFSINAQKSVYYGATHYNGNNSPITSVVGSFARDSLGNLLIAKNQGLLRFNGQNFEKVNLNTDNEIILNISNGAPNTNQIILSTFKGACLLYKNTTTPIATSDSLNVSFVSNAIREPEGYYLSVKKGFYLVTKNKTINLLKKFTFLPKKIKVIYFKKVNQYWYLSTNLGLIKTDLKSFCKIIAPYKPIDIVEFPKGSGQIWLSWKHLYRLNKDTLTQVYNLGPDTVNNLSKFSCTSNYIYCGANKLYRFDKNGNQTEIKYNTNTSSRAYFYAIYAINDDNIWVSNDEEVVKLTNLFSKPESFSIPNDAIMPQKFGNDKISYIDINKGALIIQSINGKKQVFPGFTTKDLQTIINEDLYYYEILDSNKIIFCTLYHLFFFDKTLKKLNIPHKFFYQSLKLKSGNIAVTFEKGVCILDSKGNLLKLATTNEGYLTTSINQDDNNNVFVGTISGLKTIVDGKLQKVLINNEVSTDFIEQVYWYKGLLIVNQLSKGISVLKKVGNAKYTELALFSDENGLLRNNVEHIEMDSSGHLLVNYGSSILSIIKLNVNDIKLSKIRHLDLNQLSTDVNPKINFCKLFNGFAMVGIDNTNWNIKIKHLVNQPLFVPNVMLQDIEVFREKVNWIERGDSIAYNNVPNEIKFKSNENYLTFNFVPITNNFSGNITIQYFLEGVDKTWQKLNKSNELTYTNLNYGNYKLLVKAINNNEVEGPVSVYYFSINTPWYYTWWAKTLLVVFILGVILAIFKLREKFLKRQIQVEKSIIESEVKALRAQINPHFINNIFLEISLKVAHQNTLQLDSFLGKVANYFRQVLLNTEVMSISIENEIIFLNQYLDFLQSLNNNSFNFEIILDDKLDTLIEIPSMVIQPFVENSIKHGLFTKGDNNYIHINFYSIEGYLVVEVTDNGVGSNNLYSKSNISKGNILTTKRLNLYYNFFKNKPTIKFEPNYLGTHGFFTMISFPTE